MIACVPRLPASPEGGDPARPDQDLGVGAGSNWHLQEAVGRNEALRMFTWAPAYATRRENDVGTLEVGKRADVSVFGQDLLRIPPAEILTAQPVMTIVDGVVFGDDDRSP